MAKSIIVELPPPTNYHEEELNTQIATALQFMMAALALVILLQEIYLVQIVRPILVCSASFVTFIVYVLTIVGRKGLQTEGPAVLKKVFSNPIAIFLVILGICILFKIGYYSILYLVPSVILTVVLLLNFSKGLTFTEKVTSVAFVLMNKFFALSLLKEENFIQLEWQVIFCFPIFSLIGFLLEIAHDVLEQKNQRSFNFSYSTYKIFVFNKIMTSEFIFNSLLFTLKHFMHPQTYIAMVAAQVALNLALTLLLIIFKREITLFITCPQFTQWEALFRVRQREFIEIYDPKVCQQKRSWYDQTCGKCEKQATVVNFPCGHLITCKTCSDALDHKEFVFCLLCGEQVTRKKQLKLDAYRFKYGYVGKIFIEKKLLPNQFLIYN